MLKFFEVEKKTLKKSGINAPRIPLKDEGPSQNSSLGGGGIQNGGTHDFVNLNFYCLQLSSKYDNAITS